ncbi:uncharacterized protein LTR77_007013 [Saxophila tyrrhenica]|uniref:PHD-type domain-containing protein n=1 Tax=Saxophila tyrrhenica TaxID=1690608 RepID=A0AAV9PAD6_9PEZI|nr:hypothetical protein LTR77_007013 [Saxophila tyrrhenica]
MPRYKRTADEAQLDVPTEPAVAPEDVETLEKLRNMWEFAALMQYIYMFGDALKIDDKFEIENLESECLMSEPSPKLAQIGLQLLKQVSSHKPLNLELFDEYTRRQYLAKAPQRNPFGDDETAVRFNDLDAFTRVRVLHQLSTWTLVNTERLRGLMPADSEPLDWRMEPLGWDKEDRAYFVLDDNRLYRRADIPLAPPSPPPKPKAKSKAAPKKGRSRGTRSSKRRKVEESEDEEMEEVPEGVKDEVQEDTEAGATNEDTSEVDEEAGYGFTNKTWRCIAVTLDDYNDFLATIFRSRDPNEKHLRKMVEESIIPVMEERNERLQQQKLAELRKMEVQAQMATAKRSGRLAAKQEREQEEQEKRDAEEKRKRDLREAHEEQERLKRAEEGHESRRQTREQRLKEREMKRILHEEQLAKLEEDATRASSQDPANDVAEPEGPKRVSNRQNKSERERHKQELERLAQEEDNWYFDCVKCHKYGDNFDDGAHSLACEKCNVWQHSKCHGIEPEQAEDPNFHFICARCNQKEEDAKKPKIAPLKLGKNRQSSSPAEKKSASRPTSSQTPNGTPKGSLPDHIARQLDRVHEPQYQPPFQHGHPYGQMNNGPSLSPYGQAQGPPGSRYPPVGNFAPRAQQVSPPQQPWQGSHFPPPHRPSSSEYAGSPPPHMANGYGSPFQHQQHHQAMHQNAVSGAGGHPGYQHQGPTYQAPQMNSSSPDMSPLNRPPQMQYHYYQPQVNGYAPQPQMQPAPHLQRPGSQGQHPNGAHQQAMQMNGRPGTSPQPQLQPRPRQPSHGQQMYQAPQGYTPSPSQPQAVQPHNVTSRSPSATFPPRPAQPQQYAPSPVKISPQPHPAQPHQDQPQYQQRRPSFQANQTPTAPQAFRSPSSNGYGPSHATPHQQTPVVPPLASPQTAQAHPSPAGSNANAVAADGMSGPWPETSKVIPQKHDQSPAAAPLPETMLHGASHGRPSSADQRAVPVPASSPQTGVDASAIMPPFALSPTQQMQDQAQATGPGSVPVKRSPVVGNDSTLAQAPSAPEQMAANGYVGQQQEVPGHS